MPDTSFLDWPFFDARHKQLAAELDAWAVREIAPLAENEPHDTASVDALARRLVALLGDAGHLKLCADEKLDVRAVCLAREIFARHCGLADFAFVMQGLGSRPIATFGAPELKSRYLPAIAAGKRIAAFALTEPDSGSDVAALTTSARADGNRYVLDGTKTFISNGGIADQYVVFARTADTGAKGLSAFVVDVDTPGFSVSGRIDVIAPHPLATISFKSCRVPATQMLGAPGDGFKVAMTTLDTFRPSVGAAALGFARRALDEALARAKSRVAFGKPIAEHQLIQEKLADMALKIDAAALLVYRAAWTKDRFDRRVTREAAMAKLYATESAQQVIDDAVQIFGGAGVVAGAPVERLYREIRALRIYEGTSEIQKLIIAGQALAAAG